jgi:hypothetical protein
MKGQRDGIHLRGPMPGCWAYVLMGLALAILIFALTTIGVL